LVITYCLIFKASIGPPLLHAISGWVIVVTANRMDLVSRRRQLMPYSGGGGSGSVWHCMASVLFQPSVE
jgi:hypothetical protein